MQSKWTFYLAWLLCLTVQTTLAEPSAFFGNGYWISRSKTNTYESLIRIHADSGFYCVLDGKSSFPFAIVGDSLTTSMNGKNQIVWYPSSGDIQISGQEKGSVYADRFGETDSTTYYTKCGSEEGKSTTAIHRIRKPPRSRMRYPLLPWNVLGRPAP